MYAVAYSLQNSSKCPNDPTDAASQCDPACFNVYTLVLRWMFNTPAFGQTVELVSSPLAMLVALWGMTTKRYLRIMFSKRQESSQVDVQSLRA
jgi:hypothetical protein